MPFPCFLCSVHVSVSAYELDLVGKWPYCSKNLFPTKARIFHSFLDALPTPDLSRLSHSSSSGGDVSIFPVFASRIKTKTFDVCIARYCKNLRVAGSLRLIFAHMKLRASSIAWVRRNCPLEDPLWWFTDNSLALSNWKYGIKPCSRYACQSGNILCSYGGSTTEQKLGSRQD